MDIKRNSPEWWMAQIIKGMEWRKKRAKEARWNDIRAYYENEYVLPSQPNFNLIYMLANSLIPSLVFQSPHITNTARRPEYQYWAQFFDGIDNWLLDELEVADILKRAVLQGFLYNTFALKLGYDFAEGAPNPEGMVFEKIPGAIDRTRRTNRPWIDLITPDRLIVAPGTRDMKNCLWAAICYTIPLSVMKSLGYKKVEATHVPDQVAKDDSNKWTEQFGDDNGYVSFYEVHNAEDGSWFCLDVNGKIIQDRVADPCQVDGLPIEIISFNPGVSSVWGTPDALYVESQMLEGNECRQDGRYQRKLANLKFIYDRELLKKEEVDKLLSGPVTTAVGAALPDDKKLSDCIIPFQPAINTGYLEYQKATLNDAQLLSGVGPNQFGTFAPGRRTKYETQVVEERNLLRTGARRQEIADAVANLVYKMNCLIVENWKAPVVAKVIGADAAVRWVSALPSEFSEISSSLVTRVNVESMTPVSKDARRQEMIQVLQILAKMQGVNVMPILNSFLSSFNWADITQVLPEVNQSPMGMNEYQAQQQQMMRDPGLANKIQQNLGGVSQLIGRMPEGGQANAG